MITPPLTCWAIWLEAEAVMGGSDTPGIFPVGKVLLGLSSDALPAFLLLHCCPVPVDAGRFGVCFLGYPTRNIHKCAFIYTVINTSGFNWSPTHKSQSNVTLHVATRRCGIRVSVRITRFVLPPAFCRRLFDFCHISTPLFCRLRRFAGKALSQRLRKDILSLTQKRLNIYTLLLMTNVFIARDERVYRYRRTRVSLQTNAFIARDLNESLSTTSKLNYRRYQRKNVLHSLSRSCGTTNLYFLWSTRCFYFACSATRRDSVSLTFATHSRLP